MLFADTSVWSLALRRTGHRPNRYTRRLQRALAEEDVPTTGVVVQELLQGFPPGTHRDRLLSQMSQLPLLTPSRQDHVVAADVFTTCRQAGIQLPTVDSLIAALCIRRGLVLLTTDKDFVHAAKHTDLVVWARRPGRNVKRTIAQALSNASAMTAS